jgi:HD-GYP domain-containing protein (c-di-GMP phosphodiesterase class II)
LERIRLSELLSCFAFAGDLGQGQSLGHVLATTQLATRLGERAGLTASEQADVYFTALLMHSGCTAGAADVAAFLQNDDLAAQAELCLFDPDNVLQIMRWMARSVAPGLPLYARLLKTVQAMANGEKVFRDVAVGWSDVASRIAARLGMSEATREGLYYICETWNGKGPHKKRAGDVPLAARIVYLAMTLEILRTTQGPEAAREAAISRRGRSFDPDVVDAFLAAGDSIWEGISREESWEAVLAIEPQPWRYVERDRLDDVMLAFADYSDLKTPRSSFHSRRTCEVAEAIARALRLPEEEAALARRAGLVHDLGQVAVPSLILDKKGPLTTAERERLHLHPYYTERILARSSEMRTVGAVASAHHEHLDGAGYFRGLSGPQIGMPARVVALADRFADLVPSPSQEGDETERALKALKQEVGAVFDPDCYEALLASVGAAPARPGHRTSWPSDLTEREVEVLQLIARGLTVRQVAEHLVVSQHTARHHLENIYSKVGVSSRAGAVLFAVENGILG